MQSQDVEGLKFMVNSLRQRIENLERPAYGTPTAQTPPGKGVMIDDTCVYFYISGNNSTVKAWRKIAHSAL